jgi:hypothetical protein
MDHSTENVSLCAVFVSDVLNVYKEKQAEYPDLFKFARGYDLSQPFNMVPMDVYNNICNWVEDNLGKASTKRLGREIGKTVFDTLQENKLISANPHPHEIMEALANVAREMIKDPKNRGWDIIEKTEKSLLMRRTQTFNSTMQFGLLESLMFKSSVFSPSVELAKSVDQGDDFDEYLITWK